MADHTQAPAESRGLLGVAGQERAVGILRSALVRGRAHHAYLFDGPEGVGKRTCARALFLSLNCQADPPPAPGAACGRCESCQKALAGSHPDLISFDMTLAGLADEAERLIRRLGYSPHEGRVQMVIFDPADNFAAPTAVTAANRLLKTLEEPIARTCFILVTSAAQGLLSTLRSRTQRVRFVPLPDEVVAAEVRRRHELPEETLRHAVKLSQGSLGRALRYIEEGEAVTRREEAARALLQAAEAREVGRMVELSASVGADREEAQEVLQILWLQLHGDLLGQVAQGGGARPRKARQFRQLLAVREAQEAIRRYTSAPLSLERMLRQLAPEVRA